MDSLPNTDIKAINIPSIFIDKSSHSTYQQTLAVRQDQQYDLLYFKNAPALIYPKLITSSLSFCSTMHPSPSGSLYFPNQFHPVLVNSFVPKSSTLYVIASNGTWLLNCAKKSTLNVDSATKTMGFLILMCGFSKAISQRMHP